MKMYRCELVHWASGLEPWGQPSLNTSQVQSLNLVPASVVPLLLSSSQHMEVALVWRQLELCPYQHALLLVLLWVYLTFAHRMHFFPVIVNVICHEQIYIQIFPHIFASFHLPWMVHMSKNTCHCCTIVKKSFLEQCYFNFIFKSFVEGLEL